MKMAESVPKHKKKIKSDIDLTVTLQILKIERKTSKVVTLCLFIFSFYIVSDIIIYLEVKDTV